MFRIYVGFTQRPVFGDYVPTFDGYREGADQKTVAVDLPLFAASLEPEEIAEAAFEATNAPFDVLGLAAAIRYRLNAVAESDGYESGVRSLSVGDTVTIGEVRLACDRVGWVRI